VKALIAQKLSGDDFSLWSFSGGEVKEVVPFTSDAKRVSHAVDEIRPFGRTAFYDALAKIPDKTLHGKNGSRAIILLTDGIDNASTLTKDDLAVLLEGVAVPVYPLGLRSSGSPVEGAPGVSPDVLMNLEILAHVARVTGGRIAILNDPAQLSDAIRLIEKD